MVALSKQLQSYFAEAEEKAVARFEELREAILLEFSKPERDAKAEAFADPDYQFVLRDAHQTYARSGEQTLKEELVRLLARRSAEPTGSRTALVLNKAIAMAGSLTKHEYAALCALFFFKYCSFTHTESKQLFKDFQSILQTFIHDLPEDHYSYSYLESLALVSINRVIGVDFAELSKRLYGHALQDGFMLHDLEDAVGETNLHPKLGRLIISTFNPSDAVHGLRFKFSEINSDLLREKLIKSNFSPDVATKIVAYHEGILPNVMKVKEKALVEVPELCKIELLWEKTLLQKSELTALGLVMAHSALQSRSKFNAPLSIWFR